MATVLIAVAAVLVLALLMLVVLLQRRVRHFGVEVARLRLALATPSPPPRESPSAAPAAVTGRSASAPSSVGRVIAGSDEPVTVITGLTQSHSRAEEPSLARVVSVTAAGPMIKVVALAHGVRRALDEESRMRIGYAYRKELRRQRRLLRHGASRVLRGPEEPT